MGQAECIVLKCKIWYFVSKIVLTYCEKKCLAFKRENSRLKVNNFRNFRDHIEQFDQIVKGQNNFY